MRTILIFPGSTYKNGFFLQPHFLKNESYTDSNNINIRVNAKTASLCDGRNSNSSYKQV